MGTETLKTKELPPGWTHHRGGTVLSERRQAIKALRGTMSGRQWVKARKALQRMAKEKGIV